MREWKKWKWKEKKKEKRNLEEKRKERRRKKYEKKRRKKKKKIWVCRNKESYLRLSLAHLSIKSVGVSQHLMP